MLLNAYRGKAVDDKKRRLKIFKDISEERERQIGLWGYQDMPFVFPHERTYFEKVLAWFRRAFEIARTKNLLTYYDTMMEELYEAAAAEALEHQREELIHTLAVGTQAVEWIDRQLEARNG